MSDIQIIQDPDPGTRMVRFCGDLLSFTLRLPKSEAGTAWVRTNNGPAPGNPAIIGTPLDRWLCAPIFQWVCL